MYTDPPMWPGHVALSQTVHLSFLHLGLETLNAKPSPPLCVVVSRHFIYHWLRMSNFIMKQFRVIDEGVEASDHLAASPTEKGG
jgi:hypothetical protein